MSRVESPAHGWQTALRPCCAGAPGRRQLAHQVVAFPSCLAWGYRPAEYPALYILDGEWTGASALSIHRSSSSPPPPSAHPPLRPTASESATDSSAPARDVMSQRREAELRFTTSFRCHVFKSFVSKVS